jgi:hypothetical protein
VTGNQPARDDCYIPPATDGSPPPRDADTTLWIILAVLVIGIVFILPAVIAAFVFSMAGSVEHPRVVAATAQQTNASAIIVTYQGGQDAASLVGITVTVTDQVGQVQTKTLGSETGTIPIGIGETLTFEGAYAGKDHVVATGHFSDGKQQLIMDTRI